MSNQQEILRGIGKKLWSIFPPRMTSICFEGCFYGNAGGHSVYWRDPNGSKHGFELSNHPDELLEEMADAARCLQRTPPFDRQPFTHMRLEVDDAGQMKVDFAYIPEWDSWPGLFMKGVSELTEAEISPPYPLGIYGIDVEELNKRKARFAREPYKK